MLVSAGGCQISVLRADTQRISGLSRQDARRRKAFLRGGGEGGERRRRPEKRLPAGNKGLKSEEQLLAEPSHQGENPGTITGFRRASSAAISAAKLPPNFAFQPDMKERLETLPM